MKATEVFTKSEGIEDREAVNGISNMITDAFVNPTEEQGLDTIVDALRTYSVQTSDTMPDISQLADFIADKIEAYSEKTSGSAEIMESGISKQEQEMNIFDILAASTPELLISVQQNGFAEYMKTDRPLQDILYCLEEKAPFKAIADKAVEILSEADFAYENQSRDTLAVEINIDENTLTAYNNDIYASMPLDKAVDDMSRVFPKESPYYSMQKSNDGVTFADRVTAVKEWADKAAEKVSEKNIQKENVHNRNGGAR